jgi:hypothetical protein
MWMSSRDLLQSVHDAHERLRKGETPVDQAHAEARILGTAAKVMGIQLDHARITGRLEQGSDELPAFRLSAEKKR